MTTAALSDVLRPIFHFTLDNWLNDVIPFWHGGQYHVFFDHNPVAPQWTQMSVWAHAVSDDLIHWGRVPDALAPGADGEPDAGGIWTGGIVKREDGRFAAFYTGIAEPPPAPVVQRQCLALSDDLIHWKKRGMILSSGPAENADCWRDPTVWRDADGRWKMIIGGAHPDGKRGQILLYQAADATLEHWNYQDVLMIGDEGAGRWCECPDFFPLNKGWLAFCSMEKTWWYAGEREGDLFTPSAWGACDSSPLFYAAKTLMDFFGRRLLFGWIREGNSASERDAVGWAGVLSLPRVVTIGADNRPRFDPHPKLDSLRGMTHRLRAGEEILLPRLLEMESDGEFSLRFGETTLEFAPGRLYLDASVLEHFAADRTICRTERVYDPEIMVTIKATTEMTIWQV